MDISIAENISKKAIFALFLRFRSDKTSGLPLNATAPMFFIFYVFFYRADSKVRRELRI